MAEQLKLKKATPSSTLFDNRPAVEFKNELRPNGLVEHVLTIAPLLWRKQHLTISAKLVNLRCDQIRSSISKAAGPSLEI
jgi:hypothetical protein